MPGQRRRVVHDESRGSNAFALPSSAAVGSYLGDLGSSLALGPGEGARAPGEALPNLEIFRPQARFHGLRRARAARGPRLRRAQREDRDRRGAGRGPRSSPGAAARGRSTGRRGSAAPALARRSPADELELRQRPGYPRQARPAAGDPAPGRRPRPRSRRGRHHASAQRHRRARLPRRHRRADPARGGADHKSRWPKFESDGRNVNALNPSAKADMARAPRSTPSSARSRERAASDSGRRH